MRMVSLAKNAPLWSQWPSSTTGMPGLNSSGGSPPVWWTGTVAPLNAMVKSTSLPALVDVVLDGALHAEAVRAEARLLRDRFVCVAVVERGVVEPLEDHVADRGEDQDEQRRRRRACACACGAAASGAPSVRGVRSGSGPASGSSRTPRAGPSHPSAVLRRHLLRRATRPLTSSAPRTRTARGTRARSRR